jgi:hypothetical protein
MKWGTKYGPDYVNRLYAMVRRHLRGPFRFVCLTDDPRGLRAEVEHFPIPALALPDGARDGGWRKLTSFSPDLPAGLEGEALFLDLDLVIVGSLDAFFEAPGDFLIIHDWKRPRRVTGNSSVYRYRIGAHHDVYDYFRGHVGAVQRRFRNEQEFLSHYLAARGRLNYWPAPWCRSYKYHSVPGWPLSFFREPVIPAGSRIVVFHGSAKPPDAVAGRTNNPLRFARPAPWVAEHWRE